MGRYLTKSQRQKSNWDFFLKHAIKNSSIQTNNDVFTCFYSLKEEHREILIIRYGLDGDHKSASEDFLIKMSGKKNALQLYKEAEEALKNQIYAESLADKECFKREIAIALGLLATDIVCCTNCKPVYEKIYYGKNILKILHILNKHERSIIDQLYGLDGLGKKTLSKVASLNHITPERVRQIRSNIIHNLRRETNYICVP